MAPRNSIKQYLENSYYHLYNRGVEKKAIFRDLQDYSVFLSYLKVYILPKDEEDLQTKLTDPDLHYQDRDKILKLLRLNNFHDELALLDYCLMSNHFHFLIKQKSELTIDKFMNSMMTRYTMYFNRKYKRVGPLFQGVYKAVLVESDEQLLHLSRYIHFQSLASQGVGLQGQPSSYQNYLGIKSDEWVETEEILSYFSQNTEGNNHYSDFVENKQNNEKELTIYDLLID